MQHVPGLELVPGGAGQVFAGQLRSNVQQCQNVLKLVTKPIGSAGLVEGGSSPDPAGQGLVQKPAVDKQVKSGFGGVNLHRTQQVIPKPVIGLPGSLHLLRSR